MKIIKIFLVILLSGLLCTSVFMVCKEITTQQKEKKEFEELIEMVNPPDEISESSEVEETTEHTESEGHNRNLTPLYEMNPECVGWICIEGTNIDYPVMHTPNNPQKYLRKNFYGEYSQSGVPFLDARCCEDKGTAIIYGHNMKNGTQFSNLKKYLDPDFRNSHPKIEFESKSGVRFYTIVKVIRTDIYDEIYSQINSNDNSLILSTCYGSAKSGRLIIIAKEDTA